LSQRVSLAFGTNRDYLLVDPRLKTLGPGLYVQVDVGLVTKVIEPLWSIKPETGSRLRRRIEAILDWAAVRGYRQGDNPARWRGHLDKLLPKVSVARKAKRERTGRAEHHAALPYAELPGFMVELRKRDATDARALQFTILTGVRTSAAIGATCDEVTSIFIADLRRLKVDFCVPGDPLSDETWIAPLDSAYGTVPDAADPKE
jgi:integrase